VRTLPAILYPCRQQINPGDAAERLCRESRNSNVGANRALEFAV
jgi:hypothetical protein